MAEARSLSGCLLVALLAACGASERGETTTAPDPVPAPAPVAADAAPTIAAGRAVQADARETHLRNLRQLTFGGENAEAYWSPDGTRLMFQATREQGSCDQQYVIDLRTGDETMVSTGRGRTTCGYFGFPEASYFVYASTHHRDEACPPPPDRSQGYVWPLHDFDVFRAAIDGSGLTPLTDRAGYDAEATLRFTDGLVVFTSDRDGDLDLYTMKPDGSEVQRITSEPGYDGGAFFSPDGRKLVWRASRPEGEALEAYRALLERDLVRPSHMEIFVANADGSEARQITDNGAANFAPYFLPDSRRVLYSSNAGGSPREFDIYLLDSETPDAAPEQVTFAEGFDGFPMFSPDGRHLAFASNRNGEEQGETNVFVAEWVE